MHGGTSQTDPPGTDGHPFIGEYKAVRIPSPRVGPLGVIGSKEKGRRVAGGSSRANPVPKVCSQHHACTQQGSTIHCFTGEFLVAAPRCRKLQEAQDQS